MRVAFGRLLPRAADLVVFRSMDSLGAGASGLPFEGARCFQASALVNLSLAPDIDDREQKDVPLNFASD
eukprot:6514627-Lingulodinium_polyedra.AAC.1